MLTVAVATHLVEIRADEREDLATRTINKLGQAMKK